MPTPDSASEGPFVGSRCLAGPGGRWSEATIRRLNADGTFNIEFDVKELVIMPIWYGVTLEELSFGDDQAWPAFFVRLCPGRTLRREEFVAALQRLGYDSPAEELEPYWERACAEVFADSEHAAQKRVLDTRSSYGFFRSFGLSTKECVKRFARTAAVDHLPIYWNQTRMGGRDPAELPRAITLDDAFAALGVDRDRPDAAALKYFDELEQRERVRLPTALKTLFTRLNAAAAIKDSHPNNPCVELFETRPATLDRNLRSRGAPGDLALAVLYQHDVTWYAVFDDGEDDARVCLWGGDETAPWLQAAPTLPLFFWDLAQTGLGWYQATNHDGGRAVTQTDVGLARAGLASPRSRSSFFRSVKEFLKSILRRFGRSA